MPSRGIAAVERNTGSLREGKSGTHAPGGPTDRKIGTRRSLERTKHPRYPNFHTEARKGGGQLQVPLEAPEKTSGLTAGSTIVGRTKG